MSRESASTPGTFHDVLDETAMAILKGLQDTVAGQSAEIKELTTALKQLIQAMEDDKLSTKLKKAATAVTAFLAGLPEKFKKAFTNLWEGIKKGARAVADAVTKAGAAVKSGVQKAGQAINEKVITPIYEKAIKPATEAVKTFFKQTLPESKFGKACIAAYEKTVEKMHQTIVPAMMKARAGIEYGVGYAAATIGNKLLSVGASLAMEGGSRQGRATYKSEESYASRKARKGPDANPRR